MLIRYIFVVGLLLLVCGCQRSKKLCGYHDFAIAISEKEAKIVVDAEISSDSSFEYYESEIYLNKDNNYEIKIYAKNTGSKVVTHAFIYKKLRFSFDSNIENGQKLLLRTNDRLETLAIITIPDGNSINYHFFENGLYKEYIANRKKKEKPIDKAELFELYGYSTLISNNQ